MNRRGGREKYIPHAQSGRDCQSCGLEIEGLVILRISRVDLEVCKRCGHAEEVFIDDVAYICVLVLQSSCISGAVDSRSSLSSPQHRYLSASSPVFNEGPMLPGADAAESAQKPSDPMNFRD